MTRATRLADMRRLYLHIKNGGKVDRNIDSARLSLTIAELERADAEIADLRLSERILREALQNMMGAFDNPLSRRRYPPDDFMQECIRSARAALERHEHANEPMTEPAHLTTATEG